MAENNDNGGWIKIHRSIRENWVFKNERWFKWWCIMLMEANFKDEKFLLGYDFHTIKRGQIAHSLRSWAVIFSANTKTVRRFFSVLENDKMIVKETIGKGVQSTTLITIEKYDDYQGGVDTNSTTNSTTSSTTRETRNVDTIEEGKEVKEVKKKEYSEAIHNCFHNCLEFFDVDLKPQKGKEDSWLDTIEKLNRIEKITFHQIETVVKGIRADDFWQKNFLSLAKLRKKNKDGIMYVVVFSKHLKNSRNGRKEQVSEISKSIRAENGNR